MLLLRRGSLTIVLLKRIRCLRNGQEIGSMESGTLKQLHIFSNKPGGLSIVFPAQTQYNVEKQRKVDGA